LLLATAGGTVRTNEIMQAGCPRDIRNPDPPASKQGTLLVTGMRECKMKFRKKITVAEHQRVLLLKKQQLVSVLTPGKHIVWDPADNLDCLSFDINDIYLTDKQAIRWFHKSGLLEQHIRHWKLGNTQVGLLYFNGMLRGVVAADENLYVWRDAGEFQLECVDIEESIELQADLLKNIKRSGVNVSARLIRSQDNAAIKPVADFNIDQQHQGLLYIDGTMSRVLMPGYYGFWQLNRKVEVRIYDQRIRMLDISGQEILSKDRVSLRINLSANIRVIDAVKADCNIDKVDDFVYKALQLALREAVGTRVLDDILLDKLYINETVKELVLGQLIAVGIDLLSVGVKDIILPGDMKAILNQVVEAQKAAEANVIRRREETAATRNLHNTARIMENNPTLLRLKELEALEKIAGKINSLTIHNGLDGLMKGLVVMNG
jgi:regulator of protease activity HflC (stomatin/prohibitin superfamily)